MTRLSALGFFGRFYIYAIHGYFTEVMFTALWELLINFNLKLPGVTSVWSFPIYGVGGCMAEVLYLYMEPHNVPLLMRLMVYVLWTYMWEFSSGLILKQFDACPWDYTPFHGDFMGLVTLEYCPFWFLGALFIDRVVIYYLHRIYIGPPVHSTEGKQLLAGPENGDIGDKSKTQ